MTNPLPRLLRFLNKQTARALRPSHSTGKERQVFIIGGGETFNTYNDYISWLREFKLRESKHAPSWKSWLADRLVAHEIPVVRASMPNTMNAKYEEWEIMFEKYLARSPQASLTLVGHSLGAMFLLKFLTRRRELHSRIDSVHLVAPEFEEAYSFAITREQLPDDAKFFWYQSSDDEVVSYETSSFRVAKDAGLTRNQYLLFDNRGHFLGGEFPEVYRHILQSFED